MESVSNLLKSEKRSRDCGRRITNVFLKSFGVLFKKPQSIHLTFFSLIKKLNRFFSLSRAILVVRSLRDDSLKVVAIKGRKESREGLALTLPEKGSLFYRVFTTKAPYCENYPDGFPGNFIEKKLLLDGDTGSIAICPIKHDGTVHGLLCLASPVLYAFGMFENGFLDAVLERFGMLIEKEAKRLNI